MTYEQLKDRFPKLIHASVLGYGSEGAEKYRPGYDYTAFCARTGLLGDLAPAGGPPIMTVADSESTVSQSPSRPVIAPPFTKEP